MTTPSHDLPPLDGLDALDEERAADMLYNRPLYPVAAILPPAPNDGVTDSPAVRFAAPSECLPGTSPAEAPRGDRP